MVSLAWIYFTVGSIGFAVLWLIRLLNWQVPLLEHGKTLSTVHDDLPIFTRLTVPKKWFAHFYLIGLICSIFKPSPFTVHLARRWIEEQWIAPHSPNSQMHVLHYLLGVTFYPMAISMLEVILDKRHLALFCFVQLFQFLAHLELYKLKRSSTSYVRLPREGLFKHVLCPHYLCEIVIYGLLCCKSSLPLFTFVALNVSLSAYTTRQWNQKQFGADPRAAIIPYLL